MPVNREALLKDLQGQVKILEDDLRDRAGEPDFHAKLYPEWEQARKAERVAATYETWLDGQVTQSAVAWVLATVFVRFCEDNLLLAEPWLAGPGERLEDAVDRQQEHYRQRPNDTAREWMIAAFHHMAKANAVVAGLFDKAHNPLWRITPNEDIARGLVAFWRRRGDDGKIIHDFTDEDLDTRFLGDLYQDLSEYAKATYALLQTPDFVEEFILNRTLDPAIEEFGIDARYPAAEGLSRTDLPDGLRVIDPTCGSGHFLLGAFKRLLKAWEEKAPALDRWEQIARALYGVHGVDKNPFAVAIARFRLLLAAMQADNVTELKDISNWQVNIAVGDSLLHGRRFKQEEMEGLAGLEVRPEDEVHTFATEDVKEYVRSVDILGNGSYHVVIGNPPYITVKDKNESLLYKKAYDTCYRKYALSVPFAERFFQLGVRVYNEGNVSGSGFIGQITANSFMKREFGKKLIEEFFHSKVFLTEVIDASGAYIPGHGTPTIILVGRNAPRLLERPVRAVLGIRGEPGVPADPAEGMVWTAISRQIDDPGSESEWVNVVDLNRAQLAHHPWSLGGGGATDLRSAIEAERGKLRGKINEIGFGAVIGEDPAYVVGAGSMNRAKVSLRYQRPLVEGDKLRDWSISDPVMILWPYREGDIAPEVSVSSQQFLWGTKVLLERRISFGESQLERGFKWFEYAIFFPRRYETPLSISFAEVATHNHFVLDRGGKVFKQTAPVIKLPEGATEDDHLELLGVLNSSLACFWLKQVSHNKGEGGGARVDAGYSAMGSEEWKNTFAFTGTKLQQFPLPETLPLLLARELDHLSQELTQTEPAVVCDISVPGARRLVEAHASNVALRCKMIALQEELDWQVYGSYGLISDGEVADLVAPGLDDLPEIELGQRAFEIVMARKMATGELNTQWFARHDSTPITDIPAHWPKWYQALVARRIEKIESDRNIGLIERPECKRRWAQAPWEKREKEALRTYILDACEDSSLWYSTGPGGLGQAQPQTVFSLADRLRSKPEVVEAARLYSGSNTDLSKVLEEILKDEHVPFLAAMRYKPDGLRKRAQWERTWELQREEDATGTKLDIPVPPKYSSSDFLKTSYWRHRGKLDVPKERFISYPGVSPDQDGSLLLGWAGWDHKDQAVALVNLVHDRKTKSSWEADRLTPLLAGLAELMPWLRHWFSEPDPSLGGYIPSEMFDQALRAELGALGLTEEDLAAWRPAKATRGRKSAR